MSFRIFRYFQRATCFSVALFFTSNLAFSAKLETYQDVIEKAFNLSLQKDRTQAVNLLVSAAQKESKKGQAPKELLAALEEVTTVFYSDKAQQNFELGLSLRMTDPTLAQTKLSEAIKIEPDNLQILLAQTRLQIAGADCGNAQKQAQKLLEKNPYSEELQLVLAQSSICLGQSVDTLKTKINFDTKKQNQDMFWLLLEVESLFRQGLFTKARELAEQAVRQDSAFPEGHYWLWKLAISQKQKNDRAGQKYLSACKSLSARAQRTYLRDPQLCRRTTEVEAETKKNNANGDI